MFSTLFWALYGVDVLSRITSLAASMLGIMFLVIPVVGFLCALASESYAEFSERATAVFGGWRKAIIFFVLFLYAVSLFIPSKQTMYMMLGVKATDNIVNSETGQKVQRIVNDKLDEYINELNSKNKENK